MSKKILQLKIITPEALIMEDLVEHVTVPTTEGEITILPDHIPLVVGLKSGDIVAFEGGEQIPMAVSGGFLEVKKGEKYTEVAVLADFAERVVDMTEEKISAARAYADKLRKQMEDKSLVDFEHFESELERSLTRVKIADKWKSKKYRR